MVNFAMTNTPAVKMTPYAINQHVFGRPPQKPSLYQKLWDQIIGDTHLTPKGSALHLRQLRSRVKHLVNIQASDQELGKTFKAFADVFKERTDIFYTLDHKGRFLDSNWGGSGVSLLDKKWLQAQKRGDKIRSHLLNSSFSPKEQKRLSYFMREEGFKPSYWQLAAQITAGGLVGALAGGAIYHYRDSLTTHLTTAYNFLSAGKNNLLQHFSGKSS